MATDDNQAKWARARAIVSQDEALRDQWEKHCYASALQQRFAEARPAEVMRMFSEGVNENGRPLNQFEFEALCERWCEVFGEFPPLGNASPEPEKSPLPPDDAMLRMRDVVRITGLSKSTIKRWVADPENDFPKPVKLSPRRLGWRADQVKAWRKRIEDRLRTTRQ